MNKAFFLSVLVACIALLSSCAPQSVETPAVQTKTGDGQISVDGKEATLQEISRLSLLASKETITESDLAALESMTAQNEEASDEVGEIKTLVSYKEYMHVSHSLAFLDGQIRTGKHSLCPAHALAHYYVFKKHGEDEMANEALEEAEEQLPRWKVVAKEFDEEYPGQVSYDTILASIEEHMGSIEQGETTATKDEISFLANEGSLCVEDNEEETH
jgi:hypothetical protein